MMLTNAWPIFTPQPGNNVSLTVNKDGDGQGRVIAIQPTFSVIDCGPVCSDTLPFGTQVVLRAEPDPGSGFEFWSGCDQVNLFECVIDMNSPRRVSPPPFSIWDRETWRARCQ